MTGKSSGKGAAPGNTPPTAPTDFLLTAHPDPVGAHCDSHHPGDRIGAWRIEALLGHGGMGAVYLAARADGSYDQQVALKRVAHADEQFRLLFHAERQRLAALDHPNISRIIDAGEDDQGAPFVVMEYVDGVAIDRYCLEQQLGARSRLRLFSALCDAVAHAHDRFILHRDLKPSNVLVDRSGRVRLIDFGVAAILDDAGCAEPGPLTRAYAAPEQIEGRPLTMQTDIFGLGATLYRMMTGRDLGRSANHGVVLEQGSLASRDLLAIIEQATQHELGARYQTVLELKQDVQAFLDHAPVKARKGGALYHLSKFITGRPAIAALSGGLTLTLVAGLGTSLLLMERATQEKLTAEAALAEAESFLEEGNIVSKQRTTYANLLQRASMELGLENEMDAKLKSIALEAHESAAADPGGAAAIAYSIGRHFVFKNNHLAGLKVLEPWLAEPYGDARMVELGESLLAIALVNTGREQEALPYARRDVERFAESPSMFSADHAAAVSRLALLTRKEADLVDAIDVIRRATEGSYDVDVMLFFYNRLSILNLLLNDPEAAYRAAEDGYRTVSGAHINIDAVQFNTHKLRMAELALYYKRDAGYAEQLGKEVIEGLAPTQGSTTVGRAWALLGRAAVHRGDFPSGVRYLEKALPIIERFAGPESKPLRRSRYALAEAYADAGNRPAAEEQLAIASEHQSVRARLARAYLASGRGRAEFLAAMGDDQSEAATEVRQSFELRYYANRLLARKGEGPRAILAE
ncbi:MAG: serine/threonine-protein kinase [Xanthomonadales bacterium]|nr:serine/threonine-protein kinase [Xanthomonadales bacterium]